MVHTLDVSISFLQQEVPPKLYFVNKYKGLVAKKEEEGKENKPGSMDLSDLFEEANNKK